MNNHQLIVCSLITLVSSFGSYLLGRAFGYLSGRDDALDYEISTDAYHVSLERRIDFLRAEYDQLQKRYRELEKRHDLLKTPTTSSLSPNAVNSSGVVHNLASKAIKP